jgi:AcrR family transcriptional regulator
MTHWKVVTPRLATAPAPPDAHDEVAVQHVSRRARILEESLAAAIAGYEEVSIRVVAERAGVAVGTLYRYFPSKVHLLVSALGRWLEGFEQQLGPNLYSADDPYERLWYVIDELHHAFQRAPLLAEAMARAYVVADASVAVEVETVRSQLIELFADAVSQGSPTESHFDVGGLLTDVLASSLLDLTHRGVQTCDLRRRFVLVIELLAKRHGMAIGRPDWCGTRSVGAQSAHWFYDWAVRTPSTARRRIRS